MSKISKKRAAVIGAGRWGSFIINEFGKILEIKKIFDSGSKEHLKKIKARFPELEMANSFGEILNDQTIEAVIIATPIGTHYEIAKAALNSGKHTFIEKPMTDSAQKAKELSELAISHGLTLFIGHTFIYHPVWLELKKALQGQEIQFIKSSWNKFGTFKTNIVWNLTVHDVALMLDLVGEPENITITEKEKGFFSIDIFNAIFEFNDSKKFISNINRLSPIREKMVTVISNAGIFIWRNDKLYQIKKGGKKPELIFKAPATLKSGKNTLFLAALGLRNEGKVFLKAVESDKKDEHSNGQFGVKVTSIVEKISSKL